MSNTLRIMVLAILLGGAVVEALQHEVHQRQGDDPAVNLAWSELTASMNYMHQAMASLDSSDNANLDFVCLMLPHHQAAIEMAKAELLYGTDPQMRSLAQEIITDQQSEIDLMNIWLKQHGLRSR